MPKHHILEPNQYFRFLEPGGEGELTPSAVKTLEQAAKAAVMLRDGGRWPAIAAECGYTSEIQARRAVHQFLRKIIDPDDAKTLLLEDLWELDALKDAVRPAAMGGDLFAVDRMLAIIARRARLVGLDYAPKGRAKGSRDKTVRVTLQMGKTIAAKEPDDDETIDGELEEEIELTEKELGEVRALPGVKSGN